MRQVLKEEEFTVLMQTLLLLIRLLPTIFAVVIIVVGEFTAIQIPTPIFIILFFGTTAIRMVLAISPRLPAQQHRLTFNHR
jgi:hypothetical protein